MNLTKQFLRQRTPFTTCSLLLSKKYSFTSIRRPDFSKLKTPNVEKKPLDIPTLLGHKIKFSGPITVAEYMKEVLTNSSCGYYASKDAFGEKGDFITSPEVSQLFGDILGIWFATEWKKLGSPKPLQVIELGPGRGTLLTDILRILWNFEIHQGDLSIHLVEVSPLLQKQQADKLCMIHKSVEDQPHYHEGESARGTKIYWYKDVKSIPKGFSWILANEFFDALPVHKFKKTEDGWREILIDIDSSTSSTADDIKFRYVLSRDETTASKLYIPLVNSDGLNDLEISPQSIAMSKELSTRVDEDGGIALIVDYGNEKPPSDTFRAYKQHKQVDPLVGAGSADLTADVDFSLIKKIAEISKVVGPVTQRDFLHSMHIETRLETLLKNSSEHQQEILKSGLKMLTETDQMGERFKFLALFPTITEEHYKKFPINGFK